jgi:hypothetical protein
MLVSSANIMGADEAFNVGGRSFIQIMKTKALKLTPGELHGLLFHSLRRYFGLSLMVLFQSFVFIC